MSWWRGRSRAIWTAGPSGVAALRGEQGFEVAPIRDELPTWAEALGDVEVLRTFETVVLGELRRRRISAKLLDGAVRPTGSAQEGVIWGLGNVAQACATIEQARWPEFIGNHIETLLRLEREQRRLEAKLSSYGEAKIRLVARLWDEHATPEVRSAAVVRDDIPGLVTVLSLDLPDSIRTVSPEMLERWGVDEDQAFARAFANLDGLTERKIETVELGDGAKLLAIEGVSYYTASLALRIEEIPELMGRHGLFVGLPTRHALLAMPFNDVSDMKKLHHLMAMTRAGELRGPGSLSHRVYWYRPEDRPSRWCEVPFEISQTSVNVVAPKPLVEYLHGLESDGADGEDGEKDGDGGTEA